MSEHSVQCECCRVNVQLIKQDDGAEFVRCPSCGKTAGREEALESAKAYAVEAVARQLDAQIREIARKSKFIKSKPAQRPVRDYAWILEGV